MNVTEWLLERAGEIYRASRHEEKIADSIAIARYQEI